MSAEQAALAADAERELDAAVCDVVAAARVTRGTAVATLAHLAALIAASPIHVVAAGPIAAAIVLPLATTPTASPQVPVAVVGPIVAALVLSLPGRPRRTKSKFEWR